MQILALDCATQTGWAFGAPGNGPQEWGSFRLPQTGEDIGAFAVAFRTHILELLSRSAAELVCYESPILRGNKTAIITARKLYSLGTMVEVIANDEGIECREEAMQRTRKFFLDRTTAPKSIVAGLSKSQQSAARRKWLKEELVAECKRRGINVENDDEADAIAILLFCFNVIAPETMQDDLPLMRATKCQ